MNIIYLIDFNCPYSYIGLERLEKAVKNLDLDVEWELKSFELEPLTGKASIEMIERYSDKYEISAEEARVKLSEIEEIAKDDGLEINLQDKILRSSKDAHRLSKFAQNKYPKLALNLVEKIFESNFIENENIADNKVLAKIAVSCGFDESEVTKILDNNYYNIEIELDKDEAITHSITATPCFILNKKEEKLIIPGAFSTEEFEIALKDFDEGNIKSKSYGFGALNQY